MAKIGNRQIKFLRGLGHELQPSVWVGKNGVTEAVLNELNGKLFDDELIKVKIHTDEREEFLNLSKKIEDESGAKLLQTIGRMALYYQEAPNTTSKDSKTRERKKLKIQLPV